MSDTINITNCGHCHQDHEGLTVFSLGPSDLLAEAPGVKTYCVCPVTDENIFIEEDDGSAGV